MKLIGKGAFAKVNLSTSMLLFSLVPRPFVKIERRLFAHALDFPTFSGNRILQYIFRILKTLKRHELGGVQLFTTATAKRLLLLERLKLAMCPK